MAAKTPRTKCLEALQLLRRLEESDDNGYCECVTCGSVNPWNEMDGGHFIPKGKSSRWALEKVNVNPQCKSCNGFGMKFGDAAQRYTIWMQNKHGPEFVEHMLDTTRDLKKIGKREYEDMLAGFNEQIKQHKKRIGAL